MVTTVAQLINKTKQIVYGASRIELNRLTSDPGSGGTTVTFDFELKGIVQGNVISIDDELMYVWSTTAGTKTATVQRGFLGSTPAAHAAGSLVEVNARFPQFWIRQALQEEINNLTPPLYRVAGYDLAVTSTSRSYVMPVSNYLHVIDIRGYFTGYTSRPHILGWSDTREANLTDFPGGAAIFFPYDFSPNTALRLRVALPFDTSTFTDSTDVEATVGMAASMVDIPPLGAAVRLMQGREIPRTNMAAQPEPRHHDEVPPGHISSVVQQLKAAKDLRVQEEEFRLYEKYPVKR